MRILFTCNFPVDGIEEGVLAGSSPRHPLHGLDALRDSGHDVTVVAFRSDNSNFLRRLSRALRFQLGDLSKERVVLSRLIRERFDLIVCAEMGSVRILGMLRRLRILRTPVIGLLHPGSPNSRLFRWGVDGFDHVLCFASTITESVGPLRDGAAPLTVGWGPDLTFGGYAGESGRQGRAVVSNGRTNRDLELLARACQRADAPLIINGQDIVGGVVGDMYLGKNRPIEDVLGDLGRAAIIAIPLARADGCFGIFELNEALALGRPILMTRNPFIDVDIEEVGCGRWIELGDEAGWTDAISELLADPTLMAAMGAKGLEYARAHWNYQLFSESLNRAVVAGAGN